MKTKPHLINALFSILCIISGLVIFLSTYYFYKNWQLTALIPLVFGFILMPMSYGIKIGNKVIEAISLLITVLAILMSITNVVQDWYNGLNIIIILYIILFLAGIFKVITHCWAIVYQNSLEKINEE